MKQPIDAPARGMAQTRQLSVPWIDLWYVLTLAALPLLVFWQAATGQGVFFIHDLQYYFYPYHHVSATLLRQGELPLWNPYAFSGLPLLGDGQSAMFYPPNWLFFVLPGAIALNYAHILQFSIAGVGVWLFSRALGLNRTSALIAALAFMFCGFLTARVVHLSILSGAALVPWVFLGVDRALRTGSWRAFALGALAIGVQAMAGHPQVPIYTALAVGLYALVRGAERWYLGAPWRVVPLQVVRLGGMYLLGYLFAAIQLVPWVELGSLSPRAAGASFDFVFGNSMAASNWLLFLFPYLYGALGAGPFAVVPLTVAGGSRLWEHSAYVGIATLGLALIGAGGIRRPIARSPETVRTQFSIIFLVVLLVLAIVMAAGKYTPFGYLIYAMPLIGKLRDVERVIVLASFALALLGGFGAQRLWERQVGRWAILAGAVVPLLLIVASLMLANQTWFQQIMALRPEEVPNLAWLRPNGLVPLVLACLSAIVLIAWWRAGGRSLLWSRMVVVLVAADLAVLYAAPFNPTTTTNLYDQVPDVVQFLRRDPGPYRVAMYLGINQLPNQEARESLAVSWAMNYGIEDINGFNSLQPRRYTDYLFSPAVEDVSYGYLNDPARFQPSDPVLSSLNVKYVVVPNWADPPLGEHLQLVHKNPYVKVYQNTRVWPRAFFSNSVQVETNPQTVLQTVKTPGFDGRTAIVEDPAFPLLAHATGEAQVEITARAASRMTLKTTTTVPRLLVLSEMDIPGWQATIDGASAPIYRTNYLFRGVVVPAGTHEVELMYQPRSAVLGLLLTLLASAVMVGLCLVRGRRVDTA